MRGDIRALDRGRVVGLLELQADAFADLPTVTGVVVAGVDPGVGWPAALPVDLDGNPPTGWVRPTQVHTVARRDLGRVIGHLDTDQVTRVMEVIGTLLAAR